MAEGSSTAILEGDGSQVPQEGAKPESLDGWSARAEDLLDAGDENGAVQLLEKVVENFSIRSDADSNLGLAAALNDLAHIYASQGLSLKSDELLSSALLIKQRRAYKPAEISADSWQEVDHWDKVGVEHVKLTSVAPDAAFREGSNKDDNRQSTKGSPEEPSTAGAREEEDWESAVDKLPMPKKSPPPGPTKQVHANEKASAKQRGRGSFTYGGMGMYSDNLDEKNGGEEDCIHGDNDEQSDHLDGGAGHVLVISGFSPKFKTKDLEDLFKPFSNKGGCTVRWIDDSTSLAIFRTPAMAREVLNGIKDPRFKLSVYHGQASEKDLAPPAPRPASTARVAQRMIAGALSRQGISQALLAKGRGNIQEDKKQEKVRRERLQTRAQLRDEAWGSDDD